MTKKDELVTALEDMRDSLGESVHVAFRKGADGAEAHTVWQAIRDLPSDQWSDALSFMLYCMDFDRILRLAREHAGEIERLTKALALRNDEVVTALKWLGTQGCPVCGIGADGKPMAYVCNRDDCPTRVT